MIVSKLDTVSRDSEMIRSFGGFDRNLLISDNFFSSMKNMTADSYPMAAARQGRGATSFPSGIYAMTGCCSYGTRDDILDGTIHEDAFACVTKGEDGAYLSILSGEGEVLKGERKIGGEAEETSLISQAGYVYAFPQGYRYATYQGDTGPLSNVTVTRRVREKDSEGLNGRAYFEMRPCDENGIADGGAIASITATKIYDGTDTGMTRETNELIIVTVSGLRVNTHGTTVKFDGSGKVIEKYWGRNENIEIPEGGYALTGHGSSSDWLSNNCMVGTYISFDTETKVINVYATADNAIVYEKPDVPFNGLKFYDKATGAKYVYSSALGEWTAYTLNYILLKYFEGGSPGDCQYLFQVLYNGETRKDNDESALHSPFEGFREGDCINIRGFSDEQDGDYIIEKLANGGLVLNGVIDDVIVKNISSVDDEKYSNAVVISRKVPKMDFVIESGNRLWGCYYGIGEDGKVINEIYASALGDPTNWRKYQGISTDAWTATVGADGPFTGAVCYGGYPLFFKENCIIRVYGDYPSSFSLATYYYRGVAKGSHRSLSVCDEVLYYLSSDGIMAYNGSVPSKVSNALGRERYKNAVAGSIGSKYYVSMEDSSGEHHLFVFDASLGVWHREDDLSVSQFLRRGNVLYMITDGRVITSSGEGGETVEFECETGEWGLSNPFRKHFSRLIIRAIIPFDASLSVYVSYDGGEWESIGSFVSRGMSVFEVRDPYRCDSLRLKFEGMGQVKILSIYREISEGGNDIY